MLQNFAAHSGSVAKKTNLAHLKLVDSRSSRLVFLSLTLKTSSSVTQDVSLVYLLP